MGSQMRKAPALLILSVSSVQQAPKAYHHDRWIKQGFKAEAWRQVSDVPQMPKGPHDQRPGTRKPVLTFPDHSPLVEGSVPGITQKKATPTRAASFLGVQMLHGGCGELQEQGL